MMLLEYFARLALLLPLLGALIWASLKLTRYLQTRMAGAASADGRHLQLVETSLLAPGMRLAVVRFHDREILLGASRQGLVRLAEAPARCGSAALNAAASANPAAGAE